MDEAEAAFVASGEAARGRRPPGPRLRRLGERRAASPSRAATERALEPTPTAARRSPRRSRRSRSRPRACAPACSRCSADTTRRARRATARPSSPRGCGSPALIALADHDAGLLAALAGDHDRAQELLGRALDRRPADRARRRPAAPRRGARPLGRPDEAEAEIRAAALEPIRAAAPPRGAGRADGLRAGARGPRARRRGARGQAPGRGRAPLAPAGGRRLVRRASTWTRWSTSAARRSPASSCRPASSSA